MTKWEYCVVLVKGALDDTLNEMGAQGWELVGFAPTQNTVTAPLVFKRPKE